jgi:EAL domain-containing protein (putative c-di-GMP-specific phosphodiesterase class I)/CheY-like chemotaxis protein
MTPPPILILDDEPFTRALFSCQLARLGWSSVKTCASGPDALTWLAAAPAADEQLIFLDLNMPDMDGVEFIRQLVILPYTGTLALVSGADPRLLEAVERLARAHRLHVLGCLNKPIQIEALQALLTGWNGASFHTTGEPPDCYCAADVRCALVADELVNHYQPLVDMTTGVCQGVETLVRWEHPDGFLVFPDQFLHVAEAHDLIDDLTRMVLTKALEQTQRWRDAGMALRVAVNVSMDNLTRLDFADVVLNQVERLGMAPQDLILEVTESHLMLDIRVPLDILTRLRLKHISLSIDDFGTGYSSLSQLRDLPFNELKIDRNFVHGAHHDPIKHAIVSASLNMARELGMKTVAEGVEDRADWDFLQRAGCDLAQGYFIAKAMSAESLPGWLADWERRRAE